MSSTDWRKCIQANYSKLLTTIDTQNGLYGAMKRESVLVEQTLERIWEIPDDTERISTLLEVIRQGDDNRFTKFCKALESEGQHRVVTEFLNKVPETRDLHDAAVNHEAIRRDVPLCSIARNCLTRYWNDIAKKMELNEGILGELENERIFEPIQVKKLRDTSHRFKQNELALKFLERRCQRHYDMFHRLLAKHNQQAVLYYMASPRDVVPVDETQQKPPSVVHPESGRQTAAERNAVQATDTDQRATEMVVGSGGNSSHLAQEQAASEQTRPKEIDLHSFQRTRSEEQSVPFPVAASQESDGTNVDDSGFISLGPSSTHSAEPAQPARHEPARNETFICGGKTYLFQKPSDSTLNNVQREIIEMDAYKLYYNPGSETPRGSVLIIANAEFRDSSLDRVGTEIDVVNLQQMFKYLNIQTYVHKNLTAEGIKAACCGHRRDYVTKEHSIFGLFILSHGLLNCVLGTDGEPVTIDSLTEIFDGKHCDSLRDKPKLFFIQACQGVKQTTGISADVTDADSSRPGTEETADHKDLFEKISNVKINEKADEAVMLAAYPGYVAWRNPDNGSYFVQFLTQVFFEQAHEHDFYSMLLKVTRLMDAQVMGNIYKQICVFKSTLKKKLYLLPY